MGRRRSLRHSERAKRNHRDGIYLRIGRCEARIEMLKKEIKLYQKYAHTSFAKKVLVGLKRNLRTAGFQLKRYQARKARLQKSGQI